MKLWIRQNARLLTAIGLTLIVGIGGGILLRDAIIQDAENASPESEPVSQIGKPSVLPETPVEVQYTFLLCGHMLEKDETGGIYTGYTQEDIMKEYADARVKKLQADGAIIQRELERYCPAHYQLFMDGEGQICISNTSEQNFLEDVVQTLNYDAAGLDDEVKAALEEGQVLDSLEQVNAYFESVES